MTSTYPTQHPRTEKDAFNSLDEIERQEAEIERLRVALKAIKALKIGGPHASAKDGFQAALCVFYRTQDIAEKALETKQGAEG